MRFQCTEDDPGCVAGGSFLLAIACCVNSCKNIIRPLGSDRLPPLVPAATGEGMGVHINLPWNLWELHHLAQQQADKSGTDRVIVPNSLCLNRHKSGRWRHRGKSYQKMSACRTLRYLIYTIKCEEREKISKKGRWRGSYCSDDYRKRCTVWKKAKTSVCYICF